jgi:hypothetical protein
MPQAAISLVRSGRVSAGCEWHEGPQGWSFARYRYQHNLRWQLGNRQAAKIYFTTSKPTVFPTFAKGKFVGAIDEELISLGSCQLLTHTTCAFPLFLFAVIMPGVYFLLFMHLLFGAHSGRDVGRRAGFLARSGYGRGKRNSTA